MSRCSELNRLHDLKVSNQVISHSECPICIIETFIDKLSYFPVSKDLLKKLKDNVDHSLTDNYYYIDLDGDDENFIGIFERCEIRRLMNNLNNLMDQCPNRLDFILLFFVDDLRDENALGYFGIQRMDEKYLKNLDECIANDLSRNLQKKLFN